MRILTLLILLGSYKITRAQNSFSPYVPRYDTRLYQQVLENKQRAYDNNLNQVRELIDDISYELDELREYDSRLADKYAEAINQYTNSIKRADFSNRNVFYTISDKLQAYKRYIKNDKRDLSNNQLKHKIK